MEEKRLVIHLQSLPDEQFRALGEEAEGEGLDEEWFRVVVDKDMIFMTEETLGKLIKMIPAAVDYTLI